MVAGGGRAEAGLVQIEDDHDNVLAYAVIAGNTVSADKISAGMVWLRAPEQRLSHLTLWDNRLHGGTDGTRASALLVEGTERGALEGSTIAGTRSTIGGPVALVTGAEAAVAWSNAHDNDGTGIVLDGGRERIDGRFSAAPGHVAVAGEPADWDLHLAPDSPLVDAADPRDVDLDGSRADIGAYGGRNSEG